MALTITVPDFMEVRLRQEAGMQQRSVEEIALGLLGKALEQIGMGPTAQDVVAQIRGMPANPHNVRPARSSLAVALRASHTAADDSDFDQAQWDRDWAAVEAEMKAVTHANNQAEGRIAGKAA